jgi:hypothetical protein
MSIYKTYTPDGISLIFESISDIGDFLDLTADDRCAIFYPGVHTTENGFRVITFTE